MGTVCSECFVPVTRSVLSEATSRKATVLLFWSSNMMGNVKSLVVKSIVRGSCIKDESQFLLCSRGVWFIVLSGEWNLKPAFLNRLFLVKRVMLYKVNFNKESNSQYCAVPWGRIYWIYQLRSDHCFVWVSQTNKWRKSERSEWF